MVRYFSPKIPLSCVILWFLSIAVIKSEDPKSPLSACEIERLLKPILSPPDDGTIQARALRQRLINLIRRGLDEQIDNGIEERPSISPLDLPEKRNLQALARSGYLRTPHDYNEPDNNDYNPKRSIQYLTRDGQILELQSDDFKRSISSLARNGELHNARRDLDELLDELHEKRNIGSLARDFNFPSYGKRFLGSLAGSGDFDGRPASGKRNVASLMRSGKRSLSSLARGNNLPDDYVEFKRNVASLARDGGRLVGKRNVAALLRQDNYLNEQHRHDSDEEMQTEKPEIIDSDDGEVLAKRNLPSIKAGSSRNKRDVDYYDSINEEFPEPVYQNQNNMDYEELIRALSGVYPNAEKRFLGRLPQMGKPRTTPIPKVQRTLSGFY